MTLPHHEPTNSALVGHIILFVGRPFFVLASSVFSFVFIVLAFPAATRTNGTIRQR